MNDSKQTNVEAALKVASDFAYIDGDHHKMWVIDQMVRCLTGCPLEMRSAKDYKGRPYEYETFGESDAYRAFIGDGNWDTGIAP